MEIAGPDDGGLNSLTTRGSSLKLSNHAIRPWLSKDYVFDTYRHGNPP
jgi:hypothetical protein